MGRYIHYFETEAEFNQERNNNYTEPWVSFTEGKGVDYNKTKRWDGGSILDLRGVDNNPNLELKDPQSQSYPYWVRDYDTASIQDKYVCHRLKDFVLEGLENGEIETILTDWEEVFGYTGNTATINITSENNWEWIPEGYDRGPIYVDITEDDGTWGHGFWYYVYD